MNDNIRKLLALISLVLIFMNLFQLYENKYIVAICYLIITILLFVKPKGK